MTCRAGPELFSRRLRFSGHNQSAWQPQALSRCSGPVCQNREQEMHRQTRKKIVNLATGVAVAAAAVVVFLPAAQAAPGTVTQNVNVRSGPGTNYGVVDTARAGTA